MALPPAPSLKGLGGYPNTILGWSNPTRNVHSLLPPLDTEDLKPTQFKETFKRVNRKTLPQYVQGGMSRVDMLLRQPDLTIEQVGRAVGCTCASRFSALFTRETGMLPSEFRKTLRP